MHNKGLTGRRDIEAIFIRAEIQGDPDGDFKGLRPEERETCNKGQQRADHPFVELELHSEHDAEARFKTRRLDQKQHLPIRLHLDPQGAARLAPAAHQPGPLALPPALPA